MPPHSLFTFVVDTYVSHYVQLLQNIFIKLNCTNGNNDLYLYRLAIRSIYIRKQTDWQ